MRRSCLAFAVTSIVASLGGTSGADHHPGSGGLDEGTVGTPTSVRVTRDGALARVLARFTARVSGPDEVHLSIDLPPGAAVTGATLTADGDVHPLALVAEAGADTTFTAMRETPPAGTPRRWVALLSANSGGLVSVALLAPHDARVTFDLAMTLPTCYFDGARYAQVPAAWRFALEPEMRARPTPPALHEGCFLNDSLDDGIAFDSEHAYLALPANELAAAPSGTARIGVAAARLPLATTDLAEVELALAPKLTAIPADLATAFVIDGSRSLTADQADAQRRIVLAYTRYAPASRVQVIAYAHTAASVLPAWSLASAAAPRIDRELQHVALKNGSDARAGLALAGTWLARIGPATKRVVLFTDELLPDELAHADAAELAALLPAGTLVHVVAIAHGADDGVVRTPTEYHELADLTEGISVRGALQEPIDPAAFASLEQLVRPVALERLAIDAPGWKVDAGAGTCPTTPPGEATFDQQLLEGRGCTWGLSGPPLAGPITVTGLLWGHPVSRIVRPDRTRATALARELQWAQPAAVTDADVDALFAAAHALNQRWSFAGAWGGQGGYSDLMQLGVMGTVSTCNIGCRSHDVGVGTIGHGSFQPHVAIPLDVQLRGALSAACPAAAHNRVVVTVETTRQEISGLDVTVAPLLAAPSETPAAIATKRACVEAALWEVPLALQDPPAHATVTVTL